MVYLGARSKHSGGVNAAMCDGSVKFFKNTINPFTYLAGRQLHHVVERGRQLPTPTELALGPCPPSVRSAIRPTPHRTRSPPEIPLGSQSS